MRGSTAIVAALLFASPMPGLAKGGAGFGRSPHPDIVNIVPPESSSSSILGGCGRRHHCHPEMHRGRGPADIGQ